MLESKNKRFYDEGIAIKFENVESEWPVFHTFMIIDGIFKNDDNQVEKHQRRLKRLLKYTEKGDPILPKYYYVPSDSILEEKAKKGSVYRFPSEEGSSAQNIFMMGQAMLIISDLLTTQLLNVQELDPIRRYLPSATRPKSGGRYSSFEVSSRHYAPEPFKM